MAKYTLRLTNLIGRYPTELATIEADSDAEAMLSAERKQDENNRVDPGWRAVLIRGAAQIVTDPSKLVGTRNEPGYMHSSPQPWIPPFAPTGFVSASAYSGRRISEES